MLREAIQTELGKQRVRRLARLGTRNVLDFEPKGYVLQGGSPRQKHIVLQHVADALRRAALEFNSVPVEATTRERRQTAKYVKQSCLSTPGRPDNADDLAFVQRKRNFGNDLVGLGRVLAERL